MDGRRAEGTKDEAKRWGPPVDYKSSLLSFQNYLENLHKTSFIVQCAFCNFAQHST